MLFQMDAQTAYQTKDNCRKNLAKYTLQAFAIIPEINNPVILDAGCGTGVLALTLVENCNGTIWAVDTNPKSLAWFKIKVDELHLNDRIHIVQGSILDSSLIPDRFDVVLAEGLLNIIGFEKGMKVLISHSKNDGYLIIHDELKNDPVKKKFFEKYYLKLIGSFELDQEIWWNDYYDCLEKSIKRINNDRLFRQEINEIQAYRNDPTDFRSVYYILKNTQ